MEYTNLCTLEQARDAKARALALFTPLASVVGVGITRIDDGYGLKVNLQSAPDPKIELPDHVDGVPVKVKIVGLPKKR